jgi:hypothetical protein
LYDKTHTNRINPNFCVVSYDTYCVVRHIFYKYLLDCVGT